MIKVLINEAFKKFLIQQPAEFRQKVRQKFEYLEIGYWDGGLKVKKVKGVNSNKAVFEGRLDRASRILFTLGTGEENGQTALLIYIWGIVGHDDISSGSKNIPLNVPFLQFKPYQEESIEQASLENLQPSYLTQEGIMQKISDDSATQKWHFLDEENWKRIEKYQQDEFEMALYLSHEQQNILQKTLPIVVSGTAGSGKTTLSIYYLLKLPLAKHKKLFITYNQYLRNSALNLYQGLLNYSTLKNEYITPDFYTFKEYCLEIVGHFQKKFLLEKEVTFEKFNQLASFYGQARRFDIPLIWEEIRSIIKGALPQINLKILKQAFHRIGQGQINAAQIQTLQQQFYTFAKLESLQKVAKFVQKYLNTDILNFSKNIHSYIESNQDHVLTALDRTIHLLEKERGLTQKQYLSFVDYEALGKKKAPHFQLDRKQIYQIFEWYQDTLETEGLWDELDLTRETINLLNEQNPEGFKYDIVVCDEVQDLTDVQHELLFYIAQNPRSLFLSGDTKQIINPSGFRWEELKRHFYERELPVPEIFFLRLNFRSSGSIVELSNILLDLKSQFMGSRAEELKEDWKYKGRPPIVIRHVSESQMLENITSTGARKTILVRTQEEKKRLQKTLETELIFTIYEAKGLEFDTVLLWKFASDLKTKDVWSTILQESDKQVHQAKIRHEINLLYVAITRAQKDLLIFDGKKPSLIWSSQQIRDKIYLTDDLTYIGEVWNVISTPAEWLEQGDYFFEREYYRAAMECYKNAGAEELHLKAKAYDAEKRENFPLAAKCFEKIGEKVKAATYYESCSQYDRALQLWREVKNKKAAFRCQLKSLEQKGAYDELAKIYLANKDYEKAYEMLVKSQLFAQAAEISLKHLKDPVNAAVNFEKARRYKEAARLYQRNKNLEKAAELHEKAKDYQNAEKLWIRLKRQDRLIDLYQKTKNYPELLKIYEKIRAFDQATKVLRKIPASSDLAAEAQALFAKRKYFPALIRFYLANDHAGTGDCYFKLKKFEKAARYYELAGRAFQAGVAYQKAKIYEKAFLSFITSDEDREKKFRYAKRLRYYFSFPELFQLAQQFYYKKYYDQASFCFVLLHNYFWAGVAALENGQQEEAHQYWQKCILENEDCFDDIAQYCLEHEQVEFGAKFILSLPLQYLPYITSDSLYESQRNLHLAKIMDEYLKDTTDRDELRTWAYRISSFDADPELHKKRLHYLARAGDYNGYFNTLEDIAEYKFDAYYELTREFEKEYPELIQDTSETSAIKLYFLRKDEDFNRIVKTLKLTENNYKIFAASDYYEKAVDMVAQRGEIYFLKKVLVKKGEYLKLAQTFEKYEYFVDAAFYYNTGGEYQKSAGLYEKIGKYTQAGDAHFKAGNYRKALEMYINTGKNKAKIARIYEKLEDYRKAAEIWKELGKTRKAQHCFQKIHSRGLFEE